MPADIELKEEKNNSIYKKENELYWNKIYQEANEFSLTRI